MSQARCYECSVCGGLVRESARTCGYCGSDVATVRCGRCFMMNVTEALHCVGCGAELGLMPLEVVPGQDTPCPRCGGRRLDAFNNDGGIVYDCSRCAGQFVSADVLLAMINRYQACSVDLPRRSQRNNPLESKVTYLPCPFCQELMLRRNFGRTSGIVVDVCTRHGTWFDAGELARILSFVAQGGLQRAREAEEAERQWRSARAQTLSQASAGLTLGFGAQDTSTRLTLADMEDATRAFMRWAKDRLR